MSSFALAITYWHNCQPYCEMCQHYHYGPCLCPECGAPMPCKMRGGSHAR